MTDFRGVEIQVGDTIVYPGRLSSSVWMNEATVVGFEKRPAYYGLEMRDVIVAKRTGAKGRKVVIENIDRVAVVGR